MSPPPLSETIPTHTTTGMLPIEHFIVAFLPVLGLTLMRHRRFPSLRVTALAFVGTQFPDLIDKPLAYQFGLLPSGRVFMHSLPIAIPFLTVVLLYGFYTHRLYLTSIFAFSLLSHLFADNHTSLLPPNPTISSDLLWPFTQPKARPPIPHWAGADGINLLLWTGFSIVVLLIFGYFVVLDIWNQMCSKPT